MSKRNYKYFSFVTTIMILLFFPVLVLAQNNIANPNATNIENLRKKWSSMSPEQKKIIRERWQKYKNLPPDEKEKILEARKHFKDLPPDQQEQIKENFQKWKQMTPEEKEKVRQKFHHWKQMTPEERQTLRERRIEGRKIRRTFKN